MSGLIDGLLDISRIEAGRLQVFSNEINLSDFLDQIVQMFQPQADAKQLIFKHTRSSNLPTYVRTDEKRLRQILVNLLSNAIKFTTSGSVLFDVTYRSQVATFTILDTGRGISNSDLPRIFEPFQRGEAENIQPMPGLGLGLTITRLLTETLGGEILVSSTYGQGSTFRIRLMLSAITHPHQQQPLPRKIRSYTGQRRTIVVVDDNEDHRELVREILVPLDLIVLTAASGPECLTLIEGVVPDLFLIDISMPQMDGWQLVRRLREAGELSPIIMLSANIGDAAPTGGPTGHNDTLAKPFDLRQLQNKIAQLLGLEWVYADAKHRLPPLMPRKLVSPGEAHVRELINLGEIGYIRGIETKIAELAKIEDNRAFTEALGQFVQMFDLAGYDRFLRTFENQEEAIRGE